LRGEGAIMKHLVSDRRTNVLASITVLILVWPLFVVRGGAERTSIIWLSALAGLFVVAAAAFVSSALSHSRIQVVPSIEAAPKAIVATGPSHCGAGNARAVTTECAEQRKEG
jgi:hypothetical protein